VLKHPRRPTGLAALAWRRLYGEKTVRKAERAWFLSEGEESEALIRVAFDSLGQKQRVWELYSLSPSSVQLRHYPALKVIFILHPVTLGQPQILRFAF